MEPPSIKGPALTEAIGPNMVRTPTPQTEAPTPFSQSRLFLACFVDFAPPPPPLHFVLEQTADSVLRLELLHIASPQPVSSSKSVIRRHMFCPNYEARATMSGVRPS
jgi:hypothetical protein